jgi:hypothetical protein
MKAKQCTHKELLFDSIYIALWKRQKLWDQKSDWWVLGLGISRKELTTKSQKRNF